ncbi:MAG: hypothetical protein QS98_C0005G0024 [archaeon GW2011_AR3]|nr:MAG: hypothetical protein QS98_C0005G0024 [archaeon GW2011_AR3]MBS3109469.1 DUF5131 family protein [Candidatus Woesearchaeota archaeon]
MVKAFNKQGQDKIDWCDYSWNPVSGCLHGCSYCYLIRMGYDMTPRFHAERLNRFHEIKEKSAKIFVGSAADMFGEWVIVDWIEAVLADINKHSEHTFQLLTKNPERYKYWDWRKYKNVWIGTTLDTQARANKNLQFLKETKANLKFISFEPLLEEINIDLTGINWIIIGANSNYDAEKPKQEWADKLIAQARELGIAVWMKDNFKYAKKIKEFPKINWLVGQAKILSFVENR